ncbi:hypothetical protein ACVDG5_018345 [Mesorhizobium sp. ORM6]
MILCYDKDGQIYLTYNDPIPPGMDEFLQEQGMTFVHHKPEKGTDIYGAAVTYHKYVVSGEVVDRPECTASAYVGGRTARLDNVPEGSTVTAIIDAGTPFEHRETITDFLIEFDEPCNVKFAVVPPFPMKEGFYDVQIQ